MGKGSKTQMTSSNPRHSEKREDYAIEKPNFKAAADFLF